MDWERLAAKVKERRKELGLTQDDVVVIAGPGLSKPVLSLIENARQSGYKDRTLASLDRGLSWRIGSADAVLNGGDPVDARDQVDRITVATLEKMRDRTDVVNRLRAELGEEREARRSEVQVLRDQVDELIDQVATLRTSVDLLRGAEQPTGQATSE